MRSRFYLRTLKKRERERKVGLQGDANSLMLVMLNSNIGLNL